jgi:hypothetical protein
MTEQELVKKYGFPEGTRCSYGNSGNFGESDAWWVYLPNGLTHHISDPKPSKAYQYPELTEEQKKEMQEEARANLAVLKEYYSTPINRLFH